MEIGYDLFSIQTRNNHLWSIQRPISNELMNGFMAGAILGLKSSQNYSGEYIEVHTENEDKEENEYIQPNEITDLPSNLVNKSHVSYDMITRRNTLDKAKRNVYQIWIYNGEDYDLYEFRTMEFLQGLLTMCRAFNLDYDYVILAAPLYNGQYFRIEGIKLPLLPEISNDPPIVALDQNWTIFPNLPNIPVNYNY